MNVKVQKIVSCTKPPKIFSKTKVSIFEQLDVFLTIIHFLGNLLEALWEVISLFKGISCNA